MSQKEKLVLDGVTYGINQLMPPSKVSRFGAKVAKVLSSALANPEALATLNGIKSQSALDGANVATLGTSIFKMLSNINPDEFDTIIKEGLSYEVFAEEKGKNAIRLNSDDNIDMHFEKYPGHYYIVAVWATWSHCKEYFLGLVAGIPKLMQKSTAEAQKPQE